MNEEILKRLDLLAEKMGVATGQMWQALVFQARVEAIQDGIVLGLCLLAGYFLYRWARQIIRDQPDEVVWVPWGVISAVVVILGLCCISSIPTELFNPNYFALQKILEAVKK